MDILSNKNNIAPLRDAVTNAKKRIYICSAWIRTETLRKLFDGFTPNDERLKSLDIRFLIRIGKLEDVKITDIDYFISFCRDIEAQVRYTPSLHAKLNIIDDSFATVGSFNITGGGYGDDFRPGSNEEIGLLIQDSQTIGKLSAEYESLWERATSIDTDLLGFILNEADNRHARFVAVKEVKFGTFVEIESEDYDGVARRWLAKVITPLSHDSAFLSDFSPETITNPFFIDYISALNKEDPVTRYTMMTALIGGKGYSQLRSGVLEVIKEVVQDNDSGEKKLQYNRYAVPVGALIKPAQKETLHQLLGYEGGEEQAVGTLAANRDVKIYIDFQEILTKHFSIFGTTGSGKSYFAKRFVSRFFPWIKKSGGRVVIIDTHSEYAKDSEDIKTLFHGIQDDVTSIASQKIKELVNKVVLDEAPDLSDIFGLKFTEKELNILKEALKQTAEKIAEKDRIRIFQEHIKKFTVKEEHPEKNRILTTLERIYTDEYRGLNEELMAVELFEGLIKDKLAAEGLGLTSKEGKERKKQLTAEYLKQMKEDKTTFNLLIQSYSEKKIKSLLADYYEETGESFSMDKYHTIEGMFANNEVGFYNEKLIDLMKKPGVYVIDLKFLNDIDERRAIVANVVESIFNESKQTNGNFRTLIVLEEAHNYAPEGKGSGSASNYALQRIASEGRKFQIGLMAITQRPAYVSKDVLAQCNTSAVFRLVNNNDLGAIAATVEAVSEEFLQQIPAFETGQCIITGTGIKEAVEVKVE